MHQMDIFMGKATPAARRDRGKVKTGRASPCHAAGVGTGRCIPRRPGTEPVSMRTAVCAAPTARDGPPMPVPKTGECTRPPMANTAVGQAQAHHRLPGRIPAAVPPRSCPECSRAGFALCSQILGPACGTRRPAGATGSGVPCAGVCDGLSPSPARTLPCASCLP